MKYRIHMLTLALLVSGIAYGQQIYQVSDAGKMMIGKKIEAFVDTSNAVKIEEVAGMPFELNSTDIVNFGNIPHTVWLRFSLNSDVHKNIFLELAAPLLEVVELYELKDSGNYEQLFAGGFRNPFDLREVRTENWLFQMDIEAAETKTLYLKLRSGYPFMVPISVTTTRRFVESSLLHYLFWGLYMGIMIFAFLYNFFIYVSLRERTYFYYIIYVLMSVTFYLGLQGYDYMFLWPGLPHLNIILPIFICITNVVITLFAFRFLHIRRSNTVPFWWGWGIIGIFALLGVMSFIVPYPIVTGLAQMFSLVAAIYYIYVGIYGWVKKIPNAKFFLTAWTLFLLLVIVYLLTINNVLPSNFFTTHSIFLGHMTEVLLLSFALADRINWLKQENERKQNQIIDQLEENERIQLKANQELERKVVERTEEVVEQKNEALKQKERSDELLLNILPYETAEELKTTGHAKAQQIDNVTVIFTDIEGFSHFAERLTSSELVDELNEVFSAFDEIVARHNVEKIKTIGDAYMAASGVPISDPDHAESAINAAIEMHDFMQELKAKKEAEGKTPFQIRIGLHSGPVVAGVVGVKKFAYDIWGKTVNTASRMESTGEVGKINISRATYDLLKDKYDCTPRGEVEAKNMGTVEMFYLNRKKA